MFFGQNITAGEMTYPPLSIMAEIPQQVPEGVYPPLSIMAEIPQQVPEGVPATFTAPRFRVCADVCGGQRCRRPDCSGVHPDLLGPPKLPM